MADYLTLVQVAQRLGIKSTSQLRRAIRLGHLHAERWGRDWLVSPDEVARYDMVRRKGAGRPSRPDPQPDPAEETTDG